MQIAPAGVQCSFEVTFDEPGLQVAMSVYDTTNGTAILVHGPSAMASVADNTYFGQFIPMLGHSYVILKAVYTDGTYETLDPNHTQGSESIIAQSTGIVGPLCPVIGIVNC